MYFCAKHAEERCLQETEDVVCGSDAGWFLQELQHTVSSRVDGVQDNVSGCRAIVGFV